MTFESRSSGAGDAAPVEAAAGQPAFVAGSIPAGGPTPRWWLFAFVDGQRLAMPTDPAHSFGPVPDGFAPVAVSDVHHLGRLDGLDCRALRLAQAPEGWEPVPLRQAMMQLPPVLAGLASRAWQVLEWERTHAFCGACAAPTGLMPGERARRCPSCGLVAYPRISPAMMALVWRPGELLLARAPHFVPGVYSALAGFVEAGESIEDCVHREVAEEVGVRVHAPRYWGSQSWPFPNSLMIAFTVEWAGGEIVRQVDEIEDAQWFALDALPKIPPTLSVSGRMIRDMVDRMKAGGGLPG